MKLSALAEGVGILRKYYTDQDGYHVGAEHDEVHLYATDQPVERADVERLLALGWFQTESGAHESADDYDPAEGWMAFT